MMDCIDIVSVLSSTGALQCSNATGLSVNLVVDKEMEGEAGYLTFWLIKKKKKNHYKYIDNQQPALGGHRRNCRVVHSLTSFFTSGVSAW